MTQAIVGHGNYGCYWAANLLKYQRLVFFLLITVLFRTVSLFSKNKHLPANHSTKIASGISTCHLLTRHH